MSECYDLDGEAKDSVDQGSSTNNPIHWRERLGGMLNYYYREVA